MDWLEDMQSNLYIFPRGMARGGDMGEKSLKWTSKYGSVIAAAQSANPREALAAVFSVMRNVSVPRGISTLTQPNISSTIWRTVADQKNKIYFFEDTASPSLVWVKLNQIDFKPDSGIRKLTLHGNPDLGGDQTANFKKAEAFKFLAPH